MLKFTREQDGRRLMILANMSDRPRRLDLAGGTILLSTCPDDGRYSHGTLRLRPFEGVVIAV